MSYTTLLFYVDVGATNEEAVRIAAGLADKFTAMLIGMSALEVRPPFVTDAVFVQELVDTDLKERRAKLAATGSWFCAAAGADRRKVAWRGMLDLPTEALAREARCADLVVVRRTRSSMDVYSALDPGGPILKAGRPVLIVPDGVSSLRAEHVVIGWKDGREARRAVQDALPFLHEATRVIICEACGPGEEQSALGRLDDVARY